LKRLLCTLAMAGCFSVPTRPAGNGMSDGGLDGDGGGDLPVNRMFVTSATITGFTVTSSTVADGFCMSQAAQAALPGTYHAWAAFAATSTTATSRLGTARGWRRTDGEPFADTVSDIVDGKMFSPPRIDQFGNDVYSDFQYVLTGANADGTPSGLDCGIGAATVTVGANDADRPLWTKLADLNCSTNFRLYCFGIDLSNPLTVPPRTPIAFLSTPVSVMSASTFDGQCNVDATGHVPGTFRAAVATDAESALARVSLGQNRSWYRLDGTAVATSSGDDFLAPLDIQADGQRVAADVFLGAPLPNTTADFSDTCSDWSSQTGMTSTGDSRRSSLGAFSGSSNVTCATPERVYCFQTD
jgi:hypothetical protein